MSKNNMFLITPVNIPCTGSGPNMTEEFPMRLSNVLVNYSNLIGVSKTTHNRSVA